MVNSRWERLAPLTGVAFVVLLLLGLLVAPESPDFMAPSQEIADYYGDEASTIINIDAILLTAGVLLLWFFGSLRTALRRGEVGDGRLSALALAGGTAATALYLASMAADLAAALRADEDGRIDPQVAQTLFDLMSLLLGGAVPIALAVALAATALAALRTRVLPAWLGWASAVIAVGLAIAPISFFVLLLFPVWVLVVSVLLYRQAEERPPPGAATPA